MTLRLLSAGAAQGLVARVAAEARIPVTGSFGAVGAMLEKLRGGEPCDVVILTHAQIDALQRAGRVRAPIADLGPVPTSIAVRDPDPAPDIGTAQGVRAALLAADGIYFPDPAKATAGIHFARVLELLGLGDAVSSRLHSFPNGATAMQAMAQAAGRPIGCTQATEIVATPGVRLVGPLPEGLDLSTVYTAAVNASAADGDAAAAFVERLTGPAAGGLRTAAGFG